MPTQTFHGPEHPTPSIDDINRLVRKGRADRSRAIHAWLNGLFAEPEARR